jgi:hypothetical protein
LESVLESVQAQALYEGKRFSRSPLSLTVLVVLGPVAAVVVAQPVVQPGKKYLVPVAQFQSLLKSA